MTAALLSLLAGALLGWRFKVWVLLPVLAVMLPLVVGVQIIRQQGLAAIILAPVTVGVALQIGYLGGMFFRSWM